MTSAITTTNIDGAFPVAGQDNNSQGFRDNFTNIKTALNVAKSEISTLQSDTAKLNVDNDFNGKVLENAEINKIYYSVRNNGTVPLAGETFTNVDIENGALQTFTFNDDHSLVFANWPASDLYAKVKLHLKSDSSGTKTVTLSTSSGTIKYDDAFPTPFVLPADGNVERIIEAWTLNGGLTVYLKYLGDFE